MNPSDHDLLQRYAQNGSQAAFAELVARHLNLVYSAAQRQVRSSALAEEIAQSVFLDLSRHPAGLKPGTPLVAWLHLVTRRTAIDVIRRESRRQVREQAAMELADMKPTPSVWADVEPLLDEAVETLAPADRSAILLRFFENKSLREVGEVLGTSEEAAQKRVRRAVDQLRTVFLRRGIAVTATGLVTDLSAHAIQTAPAALGTAISSSAALSGAALGHAAVAVTRSLVMTTLQKTVLVTAVAAVVGGGLYETSALFRQRRESQELQQRTDRLLLELRQVQGERDLALRRPPATPRPVAPATARPAAEDSPLEPDAQAWLARVNQLKTLAGQRTDLTIPEMQLLAEQDWFSAARSAGFDNEADIRSALRALRDLAKAKFRPQLSGALHRYVDAHEGLLPADPSQLAPFFDPPIDQAILPRYEMVHTGKLSDAGSDWLLDERSPIDPQRDTRLFISATGGGSTEFGAPRINDVREAVQGFVSANNGQLPTDPAQLLPYFKSPLPPAAQTNLLRTPKDMFRPEELLKPQPAMQAQTR